MIALTVSPSSHERSQEHFDACSLLLVDLASLTKDFKLTLGSEIALPPIDISIHSRVSGLSAVDRRSVGLEQSALVSSRHRINLSKFHSLWKNSVNQLNCCAAITQYFRMLVYVGVLLYSCSLDTFSRHGEATSEEMIMRKVCHAFDTHSCDKLEHQAYAEESTLNARASLDNDDIPSTSRGMSISTAPMATVSAYSDVRHVQHILDEALRWVFRLLLNCWDNHMPEAYTPYSMVDIVMLSTHTMPPVSRPISMVVNGYYSRIASLLDILLNGDPSDASNDSPNVISLRRRLDISHFLLSHEQVPGMLLNNVLDAIGVHFTRPVSVAQILNELFLLERFHDTLHDIIAVNINRIFLTDTDLNSQMATASLASGDGNDFTLNWDPVTTQGGVVMGPYPEGVLRIVNAYTHLWVVPHVIASAELHAHVVRMNNIICMELLRAYSLLARQYESIIRNVNDIIEHVMASSTSLTPTGEATSQSKRTAMLSQIMIFLCSICNDIARIISTHIPTVASHCPNITLDMEKRVQSVCIELSAVSWMAAELIAKAIFSSMGVIFLRDLDDINQRSPSAIEVMLASLEDALVETKHYLLPFGYEQLLLSCEHRVIMRLVSLSFTRILARKYTCAWP